MSDERAVRVLVFIESLNIGGAEKSLVNFLQSFDYGRLQVDLMTLKSGGAFEKYIPREVNSIPFPKPKGLRKYLAQLCRVYYALRWRAQRGPRNKAEIFWSCMSPTFPTLEKEYDVAIAYQQGLPTYYVATKVKSKKKITWANVNLLNAGYRESFNRKYYDKFDHIVAVSAQLYDILAQSRMMDSRRLTTIYDIISPETIRRMAREYTIDEYFTSGAIRIATVGRMARQKNQILAVRAAKILKEHGHEFCWCLVGNGPDFQSVKQLVEAESLGDCVRLTGAMPNPYPFMKDCDIYVQTSSFEGFGLTIAEAKILGKPIVSTNFDVVRDQIDDGVNGLIADMTPESVAAKIERLIADAELRQRLAANAAKGATDNRDAEIRKFYGMVGNGD